jgi:molybdate transport system regulatory protein
MKLSIRNDVEATVDSVTGGPAMTTVRARLASGQVVTAAITSDAAAALGLGPGTPVHLLVKATEVAVALEHPGPMSIRNLLRGTLTAIDTGAVMSTLKIQLADGSTLTSVVTRESTEDLELTTGQAVTAMIRSTDVAVAVD